MTQIFKGQFGGLLQRIKCRDTRRELVPNDGTVITCKRIRNGNTGDRICPVLGRQNPGRCVRERK